MSEDSAPVAVDIAGRTILVRRPSDDQLLAWLGMSSLLEGAGEMDGTEVREDVATLLEAIQNLIVSDEDRRAFRRAAILGTAKISDLVVAVLGGAEGTSAVKPKVRRAR